MCCHIVVTELLCFSLVSLFYVILTEMKKLEEEYNAIRIPNEESVVTYYKIRQQLAKLGKEIEEFVHKPRYCLPFLQPGRLVRVNVSSKSSNRFVGKYSPSDLFGFVALEKLKMLNTFWVFHFQVKKEDLDFGWGVIVNFQKKANVKVSFFFFVVKVPNYKRSCIVRNVLVLVLVLPELKMYFQNSKCPSKWKKGN